MAPIDPVPPVVREKLRATGLPEPVYAIVGAVDTVVDPQRVTEVRRAVDGLLGQVGHAIGAARRAAEANYEELVDRGRFRVVELGTERAVRARVSRMEERVAPRAARAAARLDERRRRVAESPTTQRAAAASARTRTAARRGAERFAQFNAPVLVEETEDHS